MKAKHVNILLVLSGILFFALYLLLSWHSRIPYEDFYFISLALEQGPLSAMAYIYEIYSARWSAHTLAFSFSLLYKWKYFLFLFNITTLFLFIASVYLLLKRLLTELFGFRISSPLLIAYAVLFTACFFFSGYSTGETWFWYMVNWMYLWSLVAGNLLAWVLLAKKTSPWHYVLILLLTAFIAGAAESYAVIFIALLFFVLVLKKRSAFTDAIPTRTLTAALALLIVFFLITLLAPGTQVRKEMLTDASFAAHCFMSLKAYGIILLLKTPWILPFLFIFSAPWMALGKQTGIHAPSVRALLKIIVCTGAGIFLLILPASWILYDVPPARALSQVSLLLTISASAVFFFIGARISETAAQRASAVSLVTGMLVIGLLIVRQYPVATNFSREYDQRLFTLEQEKNAGRKEVLRFDPLPTAGMLYGDELSSDTSQNKYFEKVWGTDFSVVVKN